MIASVRFEEQEGRENGQVVQRERERGGWLVGFGCGPANSGDDEWEKMARKDGNGKVYNATGIQFIFYTRLGFGRGKEISIPIPGFGFPSQQVPAGTKIWTSRLELTCRAEIL